MTDVVQKTVEALLAKAAKAQRADEAMRFSQAALNAAHVKHAMVDR